MSAQYNLGNMKEANNWELVELLQRASAVSLDLVRKTNGAQRLLESVKSTLDDVLEKCARKDAVIEQLQAALEAVEWVKDFDRDEFCPWCGSYEYKGGHASDCPRQLALRGSE
jgi:hypothetical protein